MKNIRLCEICETNPIARQNDIRARYCKNCRRNMKREYRRMYYMVRKNLDEKEMV